VNDETAADGDLGFEARPRKSGDVEVLHHGRQASVLRGAAAADLLARLATLDAAGGQHLMARITGNYRRGNERTARDHARHRP